MDVPSFEWTRITRRPLKITVTATDENGNPATVTAVSVAVLPMRTGPTSATAWSGSYASGSTVTVAGPDADPTGAVQWTADGDVLWAKDVEGSVVDAAPLAKFFTKS